MRSLLHFSLLLSALLLAGDSSAMSASSTVGPAEAEQEERWPVADEDGYYQAYKNGGRWINWWGRNRPGLGGVFSFIFRERDDSNIPSSSSALDETLPVRRPYWLRDEGEGGDGSARKNKSRVGSPGARATWIGHATVLAEVDGAVVLTDPIFSQRASAVQWLGPKRYRQPACDIGELPEKVDAVVISHNHYDHLDYNSVASLSKRYKDKLHWFVPKDMGSWFTGSFQIKEENVHELVWWEEKTLPGSDVKFVLTPSNHWGRRGINDENKALWGSWAVIGPRNKFWFGGDTAYADVFKQIGERYGPFNISAIPIGAFEPRWFMRHVHVNPEEAVKIHQDIRSLQSVGIHWGTFRLTYEHYLSPKVLAKEQADSKGLGKTEFAVVDLGETVQGQ